jgi:hypothetical protein
MDAPFSRKVIACLVFLSAICAVGYFFAGPVGIVYGLGATVSFFLLGAVEYVIRFLITPRDQH